ncbi:MAG: hypothetical protein J6C85_00930 [Alphaproteobacteria bacterium]|nr:hypothetical protein [Alphaproteobacteria bacterium]
MDDLLNGGAVNAESFEGGDEFPPFSLTNQNEMMTPVASHQEQSLMTPVASQEVAGQTPVLSDTQDMGPQVSVLHDETAFSQGEAGGQTLFDDDDDDEDDDDRNVLSSEGKMCRINFLEDGINLETGLSKVQTVDEKAPFNSFKAAGDYLKNALNLENYWDGVQRMGEDTAKYVFAYQEGQMGEFKAKEFLKEAGKAGARSFTGNTLRLAGNLLSMYGANLAEKSAFTTVLTAGAGLAVSDAGKQIKELGKVLRDYADAAEGWQGWAADESVYKDEPSFMKLANIVGGSASQVLTIGPVAKVLGAKAAYGLFTAQSAGEMFNETLEETGDVAQADTLALANAGVSFAIDRILDPLPKTIERNAKATAKMVAADMIGSPFKEAGAEVLQQMLAENLVRKVGLDDTQDLFEGLTESAIGAFAGTGAVVGAGGAVYLPTKGLMDVRDRIRRKGVSAEELAQTERGMLLYQEQHAASYQRVLDKSFKRSLRALKRDAKKIKDRQARLLELESVKGFPKVYDTVFERANDVLKNEKTAKTAANVFGAMAVAIHRIDPKVTPQVVIDKFLPQFQIADYATLQAQMNQKNAVSYMMIGPKAKNIDQLQLAQALDLEAKGKSADRIWRKTGFFRGHDGRMRFEISSKDAKILLWDDDKIEDEARKVYKQRRGELKELESNLAVLLSGKNEKRFGALYREFEQYLRDSATDESWNKEGIFDKNLLENSKWLDVYTDEVLAKRALETVYVQNLYEKYEKGGEISDDEFKMVRAIAENKRYKHFLRSYWNPVTGSNKHLQELVLNQEEKGAFVQKLFELQQQHLSKQRTRNEALEYLKMDNRKGFYADVDLDNAYNVYAAAADNLPDGVVDKDYRSERFKKAFAPQSLGEKFLSGQRFDYMRKNDKLKLAEDLAKVEQMYRVHQLLEALEERETARLDRMNEAAGLLDPKTSALAQKRLQQHLLAEGGAEMKLSDVLQYDELYKNYPEIGEARVEFKMLKGEEPYHFYFDNEKGYVLEVNGDQLKYADLKEVLLLGINFAVQDIEGYDYSLSDKQRKNFMNRAIIRGKVKYSEEVENMVADYLRNFPVWGNAEDFIIRKKLPVSLADIDKSGGLDEKGSRKVYQYREIDFGKLRRAVSMHYGFPANADERYLANLAFAKLDGLMAQYYDNITTEARVLTGYRGAAFDWGGMASQGQLDKLSLLERSEYSDSELKSAQPYKEFDSQEDGFEFVPELMETDEEFADRHRIDRNNRYEYMRSELKASYQFGDRLITLLNGTEIEPVIHESFHYFCDIMSRPELQNNTAAYDFNEAMGELKQEFLLKTQIKEIDGKYYAYDKYQNEVMKDLNRGFDSVSELTTAGARELFVQYFMKIIDGTFEPGGAMEGAVNFYRLWMLEFTRHLGINVHNTEGGSRWLIEFLRHKIHGDLDKIRDDVKI